MENSMEQIIKGDGNSQQSITYNNCTFNTTKEQVLNMIKEYFVNRDQLVDEVRKAISSIRQEDVKAPDKRIFVPLVQQLSYSLDDEYIKNAYKKLLQSSMNINKKPHPSFVNVISQLNSDEIKLLNLFNEKGNYPLIDIKQKNNKGFNFLLLNFTNMTFNTCKYPENFCSYIDNLERLQIIRIPQGLYLTSEEVYNDLKRHPFIQNFLVSHKNIEFVKKGMTLTQFGIDFLNCCR